jgi:beta-glucosidase
MTVYDTERGQFVLPQGVYPVFLGDSVHLLKASLCMHVKETIVTETVSNALPLQEECRTLKASYQEEDTKDLPMMEIDGDAVRHKTCDYEIKMDVSNEIKRMVDQISNDDLADLVIGGTTQPTGLQVTALGSSGSTTSHLYEKYGIPNIVLSDGPQGLNLTSTIVEMPDGTVKAARVSHVLEAYKRYLFGIAGKGLLSKMAAPEEGNVHYQYATAWPSELVLAQTFDPEIAEKMGDGVAKEMKKFGVTIWNGPAMNIERNPLGGRTYEYYSEDPLHSGYLASAVIHGVQKHPGCGVSVKHFAANNVELLRNESDSIMSERALREFYLKGFEIVMREAKPMSVMVSYNKINGVYNPTNEVLLNNILREEWGFDGLVISDWDAVTPKTADLLKVHASGCDLIMPGRSDQNAELKKAIEEGTVNIKDIKRSAERILKVILQNQAFPMGKKEGI